jgi:hypothetical protein
MTEQVGVDVPFDLITLIDQFPKFYGSLEKHFHLLSETLRPEKNHTWGREWCQRVLMLKTTQKSPPFL